MTTNRYRVDAPDGMRWWHLGRINGEVLDIDGHPLTVSTRQGWYGHPEKLGCVIVCRKIAGAVVAYVRREEFPAVGDLPGRLDVDRYRELTARNDDGAASSPMGRIVDEAYVSERADDRIEAETIDLSGFLVLTGREHDVTSPAGTRWKATLPFELSDRPEYLHLFPGRLLNVREAWVDRLRAMPGVQPHANGTPTVFLHSRGRTRELVKDGVVKPPPFTIEAESLEAAAAEFDRHVADTLDAIGRAQVEVPCPTCAGDGTVSQERPDREKMFREVTKAIAKSDAATPTVKRRAGELARAAVDAYERNR